MKGSVFRFGINLLLDLKSPPYNLKVGNDKLEYNINLTIDGLFYIQEARK